MNLAPWISRAKKVKFTQPRAHYSTQPCPADDILPWLLSTLGLGEGDDGVGWHLVVVDLLLGRRRRPLRSRPPHLDLPLLRDVRRRDRVLLGLCLVPVLEVHLCHLQPRVHPDGVDQPVGAARRLQAGSRTMNSLTMVLNILKIFGGGTQAVRAGDQGYKVDAWTD